MWINIGAPATAHHAAPVTIRAAREAPGPTDATPYAVAPASPTREQKVSEHTDNGHRRCVSDGPEA
jgi:hypothetical protein